MLLSAFSNGEVVPGTSTFSGNFKILDQLKPLSKGQKRLPLYLMQEKRWLPVCETNKNIFVKAGIAPSKILADVEALCRFSSSVAVLDARVDFFRWEDENIEKLLCGLVFSYQTIPMIKFLTSTIKYLK